METKHPNIKITRVTIRGDMGDSITKPKKLVIEAAQLETLRQSYERDQSDIVWFNTEETDEEVSK